MGFKLLEKNRMIAAGAICACIAMVAFPEVTRTASREAMSLWLNGLVPMLLPFFIAANFLKNTGVPGQLPSGLYPVVMAVLSGYPMGASIAGDDYRAGRLDRQQLLCTLSCSMITGPAFLVGAVGVSFLGSGEMGLILAASHYLSALCNSTFYRREKPGTRKARLRRGQHDRDRKMERNRETEKQNLLTDAMFDSFRAMGVILAYMILFTIATDMVQFSGLLAMVPNAETAALLKGILEMTVGCSSLTSCPCSLQIKGTLASFLVSFGGLSVLGQSMSMLRGCGISFRQLAVMKLSHGIISGILTFAISGFVL